MDPPSKRQRRDVDEAGVLLQTSSSPFMTGKQAVLNKPREVGAFSVNGDRAFVDDGGASEARVYSAPRMGVSLSEGFDRFVEKDEGQREGLDNLLRWLLLHCQDKEMQNGANPNGGGDAHKHKRPVDLDFVTWRGHLVKIMTAPFENQGWQMAATMHNGTVYISEFETDEAKRDRTGKSQRQKEMCYWGYRFEEYATLSCSIAESVGSSRGRGGAAAAAAAYADYNAPVVNSNKQYCSVVTTRIDGHKVLLSGEVDCITKPKDEAVGKAALPPLGQRNYVELKTSRVLEKHKQRTFERYKLLKYCECVFVVQTRGGHCSTPPFPPIPPPPPPVVGRAEPLMSCTLLFNLC